MPSRARPACCRAIGRAGSRATACEPEARLDGEAAVITYTVQRVGLALLICIVAMAAMFSLVYVIPGDPASIALGPRATPEMRQVLAARMGLDRPLPVQIARFFGNVLTGDLGVDVW